MLRLAILALLVPLAARADTTGSVKGTVIFEGEPPARATLKRDTDPKCSKDKLDDAVVVTHGKLAGALVRIQNGSTGQHAAPSTPAVLDQRDCTYAPRVVGIIAGQKVSVRNSDSTYHTVWGTLNGKELWNKPQAPKGADVALELDKAKPGDVVELKCGVHDWMHAYVVVQDSPFFAVTDENGAFEIKGLAPGKYTLEAWHPVLGSKTMPVEIGKGKRGNVTARLSYKASELP